MMRCCQPGKRRIQPHSARTKFSVVIFLLSVASIAYVWNRPAWTTHSVLAFTGSRVVTGSGDQANSGDKSTTNGKSTLLTEMTEPKTSLPPLGREFLIPKNVIYIWCGGGRHFEFRHYLGFQSIQTHIQPDNIYFYYDVGEPVEDSRHYYTWYPELVETTAFMHRQQQAAACVQNKPSEKFIGEQLAEKGGIYVSENVIFASFDSKYLTYKNVSGIDKSGRRVVQMSSGKNGMSVAESKSFQCPSDTEYFSQECVALDRLIYPRDIWHKKGELEGMLRKLMYGKSEVVQERQSIDELVPNIAHIVWVGGGAMDFLFYLDVLSLVYIAKVDAVYIHGDAPPSGQYWDLIKDNKKVITVRRNPTPIFGTQVSQMHTSDVWRVDIMIKYGGIYVDNDVIFVRPLTREIRSYDAVASRDIDTNAPFPERYNYGVSIGKRRAKYWHLFQESMRGFNDGEHVYNGLEKPYKIKEKFPDLMHDEPQLQVICHFYKCRPSWFPGFQDPQVNHLTTNLIKNFTHDAFAYHWTYPTPPEFADHTALFKASKNLFTEIGIYVLREAGMLKHFEQKVASEVKTVKRKR